MKACSMMLSALIAALFAFSAQAAGGQLKIVRSLPLGGAAQIQSVPSLAATPFYSNITTFQGGFSFGGTLASQLQPTGGTGLLTAMSCDDLSLNPGNPSGSYTLNDVSFSIANSDLLGLDVEPTLVFYDQGTGAFIDVVAFGIVHIPAQTVSLLSADLSILSPPVAFPLDANGEANIWMCQIYDDANGTALDDNGANVTITQYDNLGAGLCDPPTVGSSPDNLYISDTPIASYATLPPGIQGNFGGTPPANYCDELSE